MFCIEKIESKITGSKNKKRNYAYCYCNIYHRKGWVELSALKTGKTTCGRNFSYIKMTEFDNFDLFLRQFKIFVAKNGYETVHFDKKKHYVHRLKWEFYNGAIPDGLCIDHIDRNRLNNDIKNLRLVTPLQNSLNTTRKGANTGYVGVFYDKKLNRYRPYYRGKYLGSYIKLKDAIKIRKKAENYGC